MSARSAALAAALALLVAPPSFTSSRAAGQDQPSIEIEREDGSRTRVAVLLDRGYAAVPVSVLEDLGWTVREREGEIALGGGRVAVSLRTGSPFFRWDGLVLQLADPPYRVGSSTHLPLQFLTDFLPRRLPDLYEFSGPASRLRAGAIAPSDVRSVEASMSPAAQPEPSAEEVRDAGPSPYEGVRVVIIDAGHGGVDPGAIGPDGTREKTVALEIAKHVAERLRANPALEVHMIRDDDTFVDIWERGRIATDIKGQRPGIFVSIHANSFPQRRAARGFETYFLSDARTEHERRVSAIENAPLTMSPDRVASGALDDLDFILRDLKNYDHAHWSENLASLVQLELNGVHPGPDRGVKQGVLAVLTNALMPSVLVEVGYLSNADESKVLGSVAFQRDAGRAIAEAVTRFFERYPPGSGFGSGREDR